LPMPYSTLLWMVPQVRQPFQHKGRESPNSCHNAS
jgi:hypothetical protein